MGGLEALRAWLRAELFLTNFRPVPLTEHAVFRGRVYEKIGPQVDSSRIEAGRLCVGHACLACPVCLAVVFHRSSIPSPGPVSAGFSALLACRSWRP